MNRLIAIGMAAASLFGAAIAESPSYDELLKAANVAFEAEDWRAVATALDAAQEQRPYSQFITRNRVLAYSMLGEFDHALAIVETYANRGLSLRLAGHDGFEKLTSQPAFQPIADRMQANVAPHGESAIVLEVADEALLPEAFARSKHQSFIGSVRTGKIVQANGETFATAPGGVYAMEIVGKTLFAAANSSPPFETSSGAAAKSGVIAYALRDGGETASAFVGDGKAILGALEATPAGIVASDSLTPRLLILRKGEDNLSEFAKDDRFVNLQGLAYDKRRKVIFVADYLVGIFAVDAKTGAATLLANPADAHLGGIDGLYLYKGDLIAIQNGTTPQRIVRIALNEKGDAAENLTVLVQNHPQWREPTNGEIVGDELHYVATSNWPAYGEDGAVDPAVERAPVRIMSVPLK